MILESEIKKELKEIDRANKIIEEQEEKIALKFKTKVMKAIARFKKYKYSFYCGMGTRFFCKDGEVAHDESGLPKVFKEALKFYDENDYIAKHISEIKI